VVFTTERQGSGPQGSRGEGERIVRDESPFNMIYDPGHPDGTRMACRDA